MLSTDYDTATTKKKEDEDINHDEKEQEQSISHRQRKNINQEHEKEQEQSISHRQRKKLKRMMYNKEQKLSKKLKEKESERTLKELRKKETNEMLSNMTERERFDWRKQAFDKKQEKQKQTKTKKQAMDRKLGVAKHNIVLDLDFDDVMTMTEKHSMIKQIRICYATNKKAEVPCRLHFTNLRGYLGRELYEKVEGFENWKGVIKHQNALFTTRGDENDDEDFFTKRKKDLVYLTADSENEIETLNENDIYIIGGFIDRNRHKLKTLNKANENGIRHARFPIQNSQMLGSCVLTVNQVFEIIVTQLEVNDWEQSIAKTVPQRKKADQSNKEEAIEEEEEEEKEKEKKPLVVSLD